MMRGAATKAILLMLAVAASACGSALRSPVCTPGVVDLPAGVAGRYQYVIPQASPRYSGAMARLDPTEVVIESRGDKVAIIVDGAESLSRALPSGSGRFLSDDGDGIDPEAIAICEIDGVHYAQTWNGDSTYTLSRLDVIENGPSKGLSFTGLAFDPDEIHAAPHNFGWYAKPGLEKSDTTTWDFNEPTVIVDNRGVTGERLREMLRLAKPTGIALMLTRADATLTKSHHKRGRRASILLPTR